MDRRTVSRREFLRWSAMAAGTAALAACAPKPPPAPTKAVEATKAAAPTDAPVATAAPMQPGEIEYFMYDLGPANKSREQIVEAFQAAYPGTKVTLTILPYGENWTKLAAVMAAGTPPDVLYGDFSLLDYALPGQLLDLTEYFNNEPMLSKPELFTVDMRDPFQAKYGTSHLYNLLVGTWVPVVYYNTEIFDAAGEPYPKEDWTWDDMREIARRLTDPSKPQWGVQWGTRFDQVGWQWWEHGTGDFWAVPQIYPEKTAFNTPVGLSVFSVWHNFGAVDKSAIPFAEEAGFEVYGSGFGAGKVAMDIGGDWDAGWGYKELPFKWAMTFLPRVKKDYLPNLNCMIATSAIAAGTKRPDLAWEFARFISLTKEAQLLIGEGAYETPVLKEAAHSDAVLKPEWAAPGYDVRVRAAELPGPTYCPYPLSVNVWEFPGKYLDPTVEQLTTGEMTPEQAVEYLDKEGIPFYQKLKQEMPEIK